MSNSLRPQGLQHTRLACPSPTPRAYSNSCPLSQWTYCRWYTIKKENIRLEDKSEEITDCNTEKQRNRKCYELRRTEWNELKVAQLCPTLCNTMEYSPWNSPGQNTGMGSLSLLQGIFPIQGSNPGLSHCRWILYHLSHRRNPRILEWVAYPFSSRSSQPRSQTGVSCIAGGFFTKWAIREAWKIE